MPYNTGRSFQNFEGSRGPQHQGRITYSEIHPIYKHSHQLFFLQCVTHILGRYNIKTSVMKNSDDPQKQKCFWPMMLSGSLNYESQFNLINTRAHNKIPLLAYCSSYLMMLSCICLNRYQKFRLL